MPVGVLVLTYGIAPRSRTMDTIVDSGMLKVSATPYAAIPIEDGCDGVMRQSFNEIGSPCNGPIGSPVFDKCSSSSLARWRASVNRISVTQFVYWNQLSLKQRSCFTSRCSVQLTSCCATTEDLQKASNTVEADHSFAWILSSIARGDDLIMTSSSSLKCPQLCTYSTRFFPGFSNCADCKPFSLRKAASRRAFAIFDISL